MNYSTDNTRIIDRKKVPAPYELVNKYPINDEISKLVYGTRNEISQILHDKDDRIFVVVGPCSIHDPHSAIEYAKKNININCISPGFIKTAMTDKIDGKFKEAIISKIPSARLGEPEDVANAVIFLASSHSDYINGETLHVNGGMYMA